MKLSIRLSNAGVVSFLGLIIALLLLRDIAVHQVAAAPQPSTLDKVVTKEFVLVDKDGKTRARIAMDDNNSPSLRLYGKQGDQRALLRLNKNDVPSLRLFDNNGRLRSVTGFNLANMEPVVVLFDENGNGHATGSLDPTLTSSLVFYDEDSLPNGPNFNTTPFQTWHASNSDQEVDVQTMSVEEDHND